jgi:hypothetical protein
MTPEQRLELLENLKTGEQRTLRRARLGAWASVFLAACITGALVYFAYRELGQVRAEVAAKRAEVAAKRAELADLEKKLAGARTRLQAWQTVVSEMPKPQLEASFARASKHDPSVENILARVYIQTPPGEENMKRAQEARRKLRQAGFVVPGIEVRPERVRQTQVRYYKAAEAGQAEKVAETLRSVGEQVGKPQHLRALENSTAVRPNHYEVWLGALR